MNTYLYISLKYLELRQLIALNDSILHMKRLFRPAIRSISLIRITVFLKSGITPARLKNNFNHM